MKIIIETSKLLSWEVDTDKCDSVHKANIESHANEIIELIKQGFKLDVEARANEFIEFIKQNI